MDQKDIDKFDKKHLWWMATILINAAIIIRLWYFEQLPTSLASKECDSDIVEKLAASHVNAQLKNIQLENILLCE